jgi:plastocyanin
VRHAVSFAFLGLVALVLTVAACSKESGSSSGTSGGGAAGSGKTVDVAMTVDNTFEPATVTIAPGDTVRWTNKDPGTKHTATRKDAPDAFDSGLLGSGATFSHTFATAGTYPYVCTPHAKMGMTGTVVVK